MAERAPRPVECHHHPIGLVLAQEVISIWVKPKTAFVSCPDRVTMSREMAKNAR